jgi:L-asparaginase
VHLLDEPPQKEYNVGMVRLFPGISARYVREILKPPLKGLVMQAYGVGNGPTKEKNPELFDVIVKAIREQNMVIVAVTQCLKGTVIPGDYATSLPVLCGCDMTLEAALAKLYYLLYTEPDLEQVKKKMQENLKG